MRALIVGASSGLGRALAGELASRGHAVWLVARPGPDLDATAADLRLRHDADVRTLGVDLAQADAQAIHASVAEVWDHVDLVAWLAGEAHPDADDGSLPADVAERIRTLNHTAARDVVTALLPLLDRSADPHVLLASSATVAADGPSNVVYREAKRALEDFAASLVARKPALRVTVVRLGWIDTSMCVGPRPLPKLDPKEAARTLVDGLDKDGLIWLPAWWAPVATVAGWVGAVRGWPQGRRPAKGPRQGRTS